MCGIAGYIQLRPTDTALEPTVRRMTERIQHRGPDGDGFWFDESARIGLGHRRLAIIDLSVGGAQPRVSRSGRWVISYNGEIYNFPDLRAELEQRGVTFGSRSDTEVLVEAVSEWGVLATLERLEGMFAFALWDRDERRLWLARDRFGEKPLYYTADSYRQFAFASEMRPLETLDDLERTLDPEALSEYLRYTAVPPPFSIYRSVRKLEPGEWLSISSSGERRSGFYFHTDQAIAAAAQEPALEGEEALDAIEAALRQSVRKRLVADVPVGAFLSAGIDSSLIVAMMRQEGHPKVKTFTVGIEGYQDDEAPLAKRTAALLATDHTELYVNGKDALDLVEDLSTIYDEPYASPGQIPSCFVARLAHSQVKVVLSGDAGDELFGGYTRYLTARRNHDVLSRMPRIVRRLGGFASSVLSAQLTAPRFSRRTRRQGMRMLTASRLLDGPGLDAEYRTLISAWLKPSMALRDKREFSTRAWPEVASFPPAQASYIDMMTYLPELLTNVDRSTMAVGLEARVPFLDRALFDVAWRVKDDEKWQGQQGKVILRRLAKRYLPEEIWSRRKTGFSVPVDEWMRRELRDWVEPLISESALGAVGVFDSKLVRALWKDHLEGGRCETLLWPILIYQSWATRRGLTANV